MKWCSLDVEKESRPEWLGLPAEVRGHHRALMIACAREENSGRITDCKGWSDVRWIAFAGLRRRTLAQLVVQGVAHWEDDGATLVVHDYSVQYQSMAQKSRDEMSNLAKLRWSGDAVRIAGRNAVRTADSTAPRNAPSVRSSGSGSPGSDDRSGLTLLRGGDPGGPEAAERGSSEPVNAGLGPEGFERVLAAIPRPLGGHNGGPIAAAWWRDWALEVWASDDLEPFTDEILAYIEHEKRHNPHWRRRGPRGEVGHYVPTHWKLLKRAAWTKRAWTKVQAHGPAVQVVDRGGALPAGAVLATMQHGYLMQLLADVDVSSDEKERAKQQWIASNPGLVPPWVQPRQVRAAS